MIIFKNFLEKSSVSFEESIWALPLIPERGFFTSWARVLARLAAIFCVENVFEESIILLRFSTHSNSIIRILSDSDQLEVRSTILFFPSNLVSLKSRLVTELPDDMQYVNNLVNSLFVSSMN